jgi:hypothetical protein
MTSSTWTRAARTRMVAAAMGVMLGSAALAADADFLDPEQAFRGQARVLDAKSIQLRIDVAPDYHLYRERIAVELDAAGALLGKVEIPAGKVEFDENFQKNVEVLQGAVVIRVPVEKAYGDFRLRLTYQGCADKGLCYPPQIAFIAASVKGGRLASHDRAPIGGDRGRHFSRRGTRLRERAGRIRAEVGQPADDRRRVPRCRPAARLHALRAADGAYLVFHHRWPGRPGVAPARLQHGAGLFARHGAGLHRVRRGRRPAR